MSGFVGGPVSKRPRGYSSSEDLYCTALVDIDGRTVVEQRSAAQRSAGEQAVISLLHACGYVRSTSTFSRCGMSSKSLASDDSGPLE